MAAEPVSKTLGFEVLGVATALTSARSLASLPVDGASNRIRCVAICQCAKSVDSGTKGNVAVRWRNDGTAPPADVGMELQPGEVLEIDCDLANLQFIGVNSNAKVNVTYVTYPSLTHFWN